MSAASSSSPREPPERRPSGSEDVVERCECGPEADLVEVFSDERRTVKNCRTCGKDEIEYFWW